MRTSEVMAVLGLSDARIKQLDHVLRPSRRGPLGHRVYDAAIVHAYAAERRARAASAAARHRAAGRLDQAAAAARLGVSESEVDRLRRAGVLRGCPSGDGRWLFQARHADALAGALDAARRHAAVPQVEAE